MMIHLFKRASINNRRVSYSITENKRKIGVIQVRDPDSENLNFSIDGPDSDQVLINLRANYFSRLAGILKSRQMLILIMCIL